MPIYLFVNDITNEFREVFFKMNDEKEYFGENNDLEYFDIDGNDIPISDSWRRVYISPNMSIDTKVDPFSGKDFVKKTKNAKTYGELIDLSKEMSQQRESKLGSSDPQTEKAKKDFYKPKSKI